MIGMIFKKQLSMKPLRFFITILAFLLCLLDVSATVKPRYKGWRQDISRFQAEIEAEQAEEAKATANGTIHRFGLRSTSSLTSFGTPKVPVILVQFPDLRFTAGLQAGDSCKTDLQRDTVNSFYHLYCNGTGEASAHYTAAGSGGAISEYFRDQSDGQFVPEFVIIGPVELDSSFTYYGEGRSDRHINQFFSEALTKAQATFEEDWSQFDNDGDGKVDMAFYIYAGPGANAVSEDEDPLADSYIWPKERSTGGTINGVKYGCFACCNEIYKGKVDGIGVFVHELSHALGLPDFYDVNYVAYGLDYWDVMDSGNYCSNGYVPCNYSAYERDFMGWKPLVTLNSAEPQQLTLKPISSNGEGYKIVNPENENEYYVLENRQNKGWDTYIGNGNRNSKAHGLLVGHIDYVQNKWTSNVVNADASHQYYTIIPADGQLDSYMYVETSDDYAAFLSSAQGDLYPGTTGLDSICGAQASVYTSTGSTPGQMGQPIYNIHENEDLTISLDYMQAISDAIFSPTYRLNEKGEDEIYDLSGRHVSTPTRQGIYIRNGHKYWVR